VRGNSLKYYIISYSTCFTYAFVMSISVVCFGFRFLESNYLNGDVPPCFEQLCKPNAPFYFSESSLFASTSTCNLGVQRLNSSCSNFYSNVIITRPGDNFSLRSTMAKHQSILFRFSSVGYLTTTDKPIWVVATSFDWSHSIGKWPIADKGACGYPIIVQFFVIPISLSPISLYLFCYLLT
jgi:hypothetical protein